MRPGVRPADRCRWKAGSSCTPANSCAATSACRKVKKAELIEGVVYLGDLRDKRRAYCRNVVREYLVWLVAEARLGGFCLEDDDYRPQLPDAQGVLHSRVFPGLRLPVAPLTRTTQEPSTISSSTPQPASGPLPPPQA